MRHVKTPGLVVIAVVAVMAMATTSASASKPEWGQCYAKAGGKYENSGCTVKAKGKSGKHEYEWRKGPQIAKTGFTGVGGAGVLNTYFGGCSETCVNEKGELTEQGAERRKEAKEGKGGTVAIECKSEHATGEATGKNDVKNVHVAFEGCIALGKYPCSNTSNPEEVQTNALKGELGYINKANHEVGVLLTPEKKKGLFAKFECTIGLTTEVGLFGKKAGPAWYEPKGGNDGIISPITPVDTMTSSFTQVYSANKEAENIPSSFEGGKLEALEARLFNTEKPQDRGFWAAGGEEITNVNTPEEPVEIKA